MNLAVITSGFLPVPATKGGAVENLIVNLLNENEKKKEIRFTIFSIYDEEAKKMCEKYKETDFIFIKSNCIIRKIDKFIFGIAKNILKKENSQSYRFIFQRLYYLKKVSKYLSKNNYDKVLLENHPTQYLALKWKKNYEKYKGRYYYHCHNEFPGNYGCYDIIKNTTKFFTVSEYISKTLEKYLDLKQEKFVVLKNCIDISRFTKELSETEIKSIKNQYDIKENEKVLLFTGRLIPEKGIRELLLAVKEMKFQNYKLVIVGSSLNNLKIKTNFEKELEELIIDVKDNVIFTGFISYEEIYKYYKIADIAVLPSIWDDPAPLTIIEALVSGLPIITTNSGGIPEYVNDECAIIIKRDEKLIENLKREIKTLINDDKRIKKMSKASIRISNHLITNNYYRNFIRLVEENDG